MTPAPDDNILIRSVMVQGGRVTVADTTMPFVRIGMAGIPVGELAPATQPEQHWMGAVGLNLDQAEELAAGLRAMMAHEPWGVAALTTPARAIRTESSELSQGDMLIADLRASITGGKSR